MIAAMAALKGGGGNEADSKVVIMELELLGRRHEPDRDVQRVNSVAQPE